MKWSNEQFLSLIHEDKFTIMAGSQLWSTPKTWGKPCHLSQQQLRNEIYVHYPEVSAINKIKYFIAAIMPPLFIGFLTTAQDKISTSFKSKLCHHSHSTLRLITPMKKIVVTLPYAQTRTHLTHDIITAIKLIEKLTR